MSVRAKQNQDFNAISGSIVRIIGCEHCGMGIAIGIIAERYNEEPYNNWPCMRPTCETAKRGCASAEQAAEIEKIVQKLQEPVELSLPTVPAAPDSRLPPEKEDDDHIPF